MKVHCILSKTGIPIPQLEMESRIYRLHSLYDPYAEGKKMGIQDEKESFILAVGVGFGYHLEHYQQSSIILLQDSQTSTLLKTKENPHQEDYPPFDIEDEKDFKKVKELLYSAREKNPSLKIKWLILSGYQKAFKEYCEKIYQKMMNFFQEWAKDEAVIKQFSNSWKNHFRRNCQKWQTLPEKYHFQGLDFKEKKIIIIAAAPSLDFHFETIQDLKKNGWILLATDTALPALLEKKIVPNYSLTIDTQHHSLMHYLPQIERIKENSINLIKDAFAPPFLDSLFQNIYPIFPPQKELVLFSIKNQLPLAFYETGGNVTHAAVSIALSAKAKRIRLFSADFSNYYIDIKTGKKIEQTHCKNSGYFFKIWAKQTRLNNMDNQMVLRCSDQKNQNLLDDYKKRLFQRYKVISQENYLEIEVKESFIEWKKNQNLSQMQIIQKLQEWKPSF